MSQQGVLGGAAIYGRSASDLWAKGKPGNEVTGCTLLRILLPYLNGLQGVVWDGGKLTWRDPHSFAQGMSADKYALRVIRGHGS